MPGDGKVSKQRKRRWFQFGLSSLLMLTLVCAVASWHIKRAWDGRFGPPPASLDVMIASDGTISFADRTLSLPDLELLLAKEIQRRQELQLELPVVNLRVSPGARYSAVEPVLEAVARLNKPQPPDADEQVFSFFVSLMR